jgi:hypothetical protein
LSVAAGGDESQKLKVRPCLAKARGREAFFILASHQKKKLGHSKIFPHEYCL